MPILYGYENHRLHGVPMRPLRSGKEMQRDVDLRHAWENLMAAARAQPVLAAEIERLERRGLDPRTIRLRVAELIREREAFHDRRQEALRRARERGDV